MQYGSHADHSRHDEHDDASRDFRPMLRPRAKRPRDPRRQHGVGALHAADCEQRCERDDDEVSGRPCREIHERWQEAEVEEQRLRIGERERQPGDEAGRGHGAAPLLGRALAPQHRDPDEGEVRGADRLDDDEARAESFGEGAKPEHRDADEDEVTGYDAERGREAARYPAGRRARDDEEDARARDGREHDHGGEERGGVDEGHRARGEASAGSRA